MKERILDGEPLRDLRRTKLFDAMAVVVYGNGFNGASVAAVCAEAGVSRRAFYQEFANLEDCFRALLEDGLRSAFEVVETGFEEADSWQDGVRNSLSGLLLLFEADPHRAWSWLVESSTAGSSILAYRERNVAFLLDWILDYWGFSRATGSHPMASEAVMAAVFAIVQRHILSQNPEPLISRLGELMGIVTAPYLTRSEVAAEIERGREYAAGATAATPSHPAPTLERVPELLLNPRSHRARRVIAYLAGNPGASNRQIADAVGVGSHSQISTLLARLAELGLLLKRPGLPGRANDWCLTDHGQAVCTTVVAAR